MDEEEVETLVQQLQPSIARFQSLQPDSDEAGLQATVDRTFGDLLNLHRDDLPQVYAAILQSRRQKEQKVEDAALPQEEAPPQKEAIDISVPSRPIAPTPTMLEPKPQIRQSRLYAPDVEKMTALMLRRGITGSPAEVFHAMVELLESEQFQQQQTQTLSEVAQTMNWLTTKIEKLEATIEHLQQERTQFQSQAGEAQAIAQLQSQNQQLQQALEQSHTRLKQIEALFGTETIERLLGTSPAINVPASKPAPIEAKPTPRAIATPVSPVQEKLSPQPRRDSGRRSREAATEEANQKVDAIIQAIISWNTSQSDPQQCIRISHDPLRALGRLMGVNSQSRMQDGLLRHQEEIDAMNSNLGLGTLHNRQVKGKQEILQSIARENLGLETWQEVEWA